MVKLLEFFINNKRHVAIAETYLCCQKHPTVVLAIKSISFMQIEGLRQLGFYFFLLVDLGNVKAFHDDALRSYVGTVLFCHVAIAVEAPENIWFEPMVKRFDFAVIFYAPEHYEV
jgi:hypothetical protein